MRQRKPASLGDGAQGSPPVCRHVRLRHGFFQRAAGPVGVEFLRSFDSGL